MAERRFMLYQLILTDPELSYDSYSEDFYIGLFETEKQAEDTAQYYLKNIKGFCDFPCTYRITGIDWQDKRELLPEKPDKTIGRLP